MQSSLSDSLRAQLPWVGELDPLAEGGQKIVYRTETEAYGTVALKVIRNSEDPDRLGRELDAAAKLTGPYFPVIYRTGFFDLNGSRAVYVVEEFITGYPLRALLQNGPLTPTRCLVICEQVLRALAIVHGNGLVHRDIKPENIMVEPGDRVRVLDFGIARHLLLTSLTADAAAMGPLTPGYGAPEQIRNEKRSIGPRTDLFAWAVVFYECWTGVNPFVAGCMTPGQALGKTLTYDPPLLSTTPPSLAQLIQHCLNKPVHRRPPSVESVIAEFERLVGGVV